MRRRVSFERERGVCDVETMVGVAHVVVTVGAEDGRTDRLLRVLRALADARVPVFLIKLHHTAVSFAVQGERVPDVESCLRGIALDATVRPDLALVTVVASSMRDLSGVIARVADALTAANARLYALGDSHNSIQCLIPGAAAEAAVESVTRAFGLVACNT